MKPEFKAYCSSTRCHGYRLSAVGTLQPSVPRGTIDCPTCGHTLNWIEDKGKKNKHRLGARSGNVTRPCDRVYI